MVRPPLLPPLWQILDPPLEINMDQVAEEFCIISCLLSFLRATACYRPSAYSLIYATPIPSVCPSCIKTAERIIEILSLSDRPIILVL